jgi:outer membrane protein OmpA-like peptidoglycan-associated protein
LSTSGPIAAAIPERRGAFAAASRVGAVLGMIVLLAGCTAIKSRLPQRSPPDKPRPVVVTPAKPKPVPKPAPVAEPAHGFQVLASASAERDRARIRAALGKADADALAAADVGYYLDVLLGRLRQGVGARGRVVRRGDALVLDLSSPVRFVPGGAQLGPGSDTSLAPLARLLGEYEHLLVAVRVRPDGATAEDASLAQQRAVTLAKALAAAGIERKRIVVFGTAPGRAAGGARVEVLLEPVVRVK